MHIEHIKGTIDVTKKDLKEGTKKEEKTEGPIGRLVNKLRMNKKE